VLAGGSRLSDFENFIENFDVLRYADQDFLGFVTAFPGIARAYTTLDRQISHAASLAA